MDDLLFLTVLDVTSGEVGEPLIPQDDLQVWLDASAVSTITIATGVSQWVDKSPVGNVVTQGTAANQPTYVADVLNGKGIVRFNGTSQFLSKALPTGLTNLSTMTCFAVTYSDTTSGTRTVFGCWETVGNNRSWRLYRLNTASSRSLNTSADGANVGATSTSAGAAATWALSYFTLDTDEQILVNNGNSDTDAATLPTYDGTSSFYVGIGDATDGGYWDGDIAEIIIYNRVLEAAEITAVTTYLTDKWDL